MTTTAGYSNLVIVVPLIRTVKFRSVQEIKVFYKKGSKFKTQFYFKGSYDLKNAIGYLKFNNIEDLKNSYPEIYNMDKGVFYYIKTEKYNYITQYNDDYCSWCLHPLPKILENE